MGVVGGDLFGPNMVFAGVTGIDKAEERCIGKASSTTCDGRDTSMG